MKVIISGAGIAGLTLAVRLAGAGWKVVVVEPGAGLGEQTYLVDLFGNGYEVADRMGLVGRLCDVRYRFPEIVWVDSAGSPTARLDRGRFERMLGSRVLTLMRGDLQHALYDSLPRSVDVRFNNRIDEIQLRGNGVRVRLGSGELEEADLLVGADGVHSRVRNLMLGDSEYAFHFIGFHLAAFVLEDADFARELKGCSKILSVPNKLARFSPLRDARVSVLLAHRGDSTAIPPNPLADLNRIYRPLGWLLPAALDHAARLPRIHYDYLGQIHLRRWSFGRFVLVGDACQSASPVIEDGPNFAMHGAAVLADELLRRNELEDALTRYESTLRPLAENRQEIGIRAARWLLPASNWRLQMRNLFVRVGNWPGMSWVLKPVIV